EPVHVFDVAPAPVADLVAAGAIGAPSVAALARACRHVGVCVRDDADVEALLRGEDGLLAHLARDSVLAIHSTVTANAIVGWKKDCAARGVHLVDAPITGGASGAEAGTLAYMLGGDPAVLDRCEPIFATSSTKQVRAGAVGAGTGLKLCNNLMTYAAFNAIHEAGRLAKASGLDPALLVEVGRANGVVTTQMEQFFVNRSKLAALGPEQMEQLFGGFGKLATKDLGAAIASARALGVSVPATEFLQPLIESVFLDRG
ncbi:MAG TPA: NAD(P)-dependent oxidoreductase, partial [Nevskiaceae bacterium]|nr:NAD(P)-dependent oxidoreductase [Nevskiaceae bacterium]